MKGPTLTEIAECISKHLTRFELDPKNNQPDKYGLTPYYYAGAHRRGRFAFVRYVCYQGGSTLTKKEAEAYLAWLDAGNVGKHWEAK